MSEKKVGDCTKRRRKYLPTTQASRQRAPSTVLLYVEHNTTQRNQPAQSRRASTCRRSECDNASRQSWREPAKVWSSMLLNTLNSQNERRNRKLPGLWKYTSTHTALVGGMREELPLVSISELKYKLFFLTVLVSMYFVRACGVRVATQELEMLAFAQVVCLHLKL